MTTLPISAQFNGYWMEHRLAYLPEDPGVFVVHACRYDPGIDRVTLTKLLYIGEADNLVERIPAHEKFGEWRARCAEGDYLCFSFAKVADPTVRSRLSAALVEHHRPPVNGDRHLCACGPVSVRLEGAVDLLCRCFAVDPHATPGCRQPAGSLPY